MDSAWQYIFESGGISVAEVRRLNRDTALPWTVGLLMSLLDHGVDVDGQHTLISAVDVDKDVVRDVILVFRESVCVAEIFETDDGVFLSPALKEPA